LNAHNLMRIHIPTLDIFFNLMVIVLSPNTSENSTYRPVPEATKERNGTQGLVKTL
jgi:hypothetical protein